MKLNCPECKSEIATENLNVLTDVALCTTCQNVFIISENVQDSTTLGFDINDSPKGTWLKNDFNQTVLGASTRSPIAFFLVPFMLVWTGGSIGTVYGYQLINGEFDLQQSLFGIPFIIGAIIFWSLTLMTIWGKVEITLNNEGGKVFTGVGNIGLVKKFSWKEVQTINEQTTNFRYPGSQGNRLVMEGSKRITFGSSLKSEKLFYLKKALQVLKHQNQWK